MVLGAEATVKGKNNVDGEEVQEECEEGREENSLYSWRER